MFSTMEWVFFFFVYSKYIYLHMHRIMERLLNDQEKRTTENEMILNNTAVWRAKKLWNGFLSVDYNENRDWLWLWLEWINFVVKTLWSGMQLTSSVVISAERFSRWWQNRARCGWWGCLLNGWCARGTKMSRRVLSVQMWMMQWMQFRMICSRWCYRWYRSAA